MAKRLARPAVVALALGACEPNERPGPTPAAAAGETSARANGHRAAPAGPAALPPLAAESWLINLPTEGFDDVFTSVPLGATEPRPVVVALHGIQDRAEWACGEWRGAAGPRPFVLCPRGIPSPGVARSLGVYAHPGVPQTRREIDAGLRALRARFGAHVADGPLTLVGFSLGANVGARVAIADPAAFPRLVLAEGGHSAWTRAAALAFAKGGGERVLFACSQGGCKEAVKGPTAALRAAGVAAELAYAGNIGHLVDERVVASIRARWPFVVEGDPRHAAPPPGPADEPGSQVRGEELSYRRLEIARRPPTNGRVAMPTRPPRSAPRAAPVALSLALGFGAAACSGPREAPAVRRPVAAGEGFSSIETDDLDVVVRPGFAHRVSLRCDPERAPYARLEVVGDVLRAEMRDEPLRPSRAGERPCAVDVYMPALRSVRSEGSGDVRVVGAAEGLQAVTLDGSGDARFDEASGDEARFTLRGSGDLWLRRLRARRAEFSLSGSGDVDVRGGGVAAARLRSSGSGDVNAKSLVVDSAEVRASGSGSVEVTARRRAELDVSGSGDVVVSGGPPDCRVTSSGSGSALCR